MSKMNELKDLNLELRSALNKRDHYQRHKSKHEGNVDHKGKKIKQLTKSLAEETVKVGAKIERLQAEIELDKEYSIKADEYLTKHQAVVDKLLKDAEAA